MADNNLYFSSVVQRYTNALVEVAESEKNFEQFNNDLELVSDTFDKSKELNEVLQHPNIPLNQKKELITSIFEGKVSKNIINFLKLLVDKNRISLVSSISKCFNLAFKKHNNIVDAKVTSAIELDAELQIKLKTKLEGVLNKTVELELNVDNSIIGGVIININDKTIDGSIKKQLQTLKKQVI